MSFGSDFEEKMVAAGANRSAVNGFLRAYNLLASAQNFEIPESEITPVTEMVDAEGLPEPSDPAHLASLLSQTAIIKLNGGLGTSMGLQKAKSLLEVKEGNTFLDLIVKQTSALAPESGKGPEFLLMNSFSTSRGTLDYLAQQHPSYSDPGKRELRQNFYPKVLQADLSPAKWDADPQLEWCPPGHGDLYTALYGSGWLEKLLDQGISYLFVSNSDNLGAVVEPRLLTYFAQQAMPFLMEVTQRTQSDKKGGHLARRQADGQLVLREIAQCPDQDVGAFQDINKHQYFNTNNLWLRLESLREALQENGGFLPLPVITNKKTLDPRDKASPPVYQLETAMGAAVECFKGAAAVCVPRERFAPVKTTADLLALRSDAYQILSDGRITLLAARQGIPPVVKLSDHYKFSDQLSALGVPSLKEADRFEVDGNVKLDAGVVIKGTVIIRNNNAEPYFVKKGTYEDCELGVS